MGSLHGSETVHDCHEPGRDGALRRPRPDIGVGAQWLAHAWGIGSARYRGRGHRSAMSLP